MNTYQIYELRLVDKETGEALDDRVYVGCSRQRVRKRKQAHHSKLRSGKHATVAIKDCYNALVDDGHEVGVSMDVIYTFFAENRKAASPIETEHIQRYTQEQLFNTRYHAEGNRGELSGHAILTWDQVYEIRELWDTGEYTQQQLADMFGVDKGSIRPIVNNITWHDPNYIVINHSSLHHVGTRNGRAKLCDDDVLEILRLLRDTDMLQREIAEMFGVSQSTIGVIKQGLNWTHVILENE